MPPPETYKSGIMSQPTMYVPGPYWCIRLTTRAWKNRLLYRLPPKEDFTKYILHVVPITTIRTADANQLEKKKQRKEDKGKERKAGV